MLTAVVVRVSLRREVLWNLVEGEAFKKYTMAQSHWHRPARCSPTKGYSKDLVQLLIIFWRAGKRFGMLAKGSETFREFDVIDSFHQHCQ